MSDYEQLESRRLDLAEREVAMKEKAVEKDFDRLLHGQEREEAARLADVERRLAWREEDREHTRWAREELDRHGALIERMAVALERMADTGKRTA